MLKDVKQSGLFYKKVNYFISLKKILLFCKFEDIKLILIYNLLIKKWV